MAAAQSRAALMVTYDLDSLVYMSSEIVEGRLVKRERDDLNDVELTAVYKGDLKPGQTVAVPYLSAYMVGDLFDGDGRPNARPFKRADVLFLFLNPMTEMEAHNRLPPGRAYHQPVESGVKLVQDDRVRTFVQLMNPGLYGLITPSQDDPPSALPPSVAEFRRSLAESLPRTEQLKQRFAGKPSLSDRPWLLDLLRRVPPEESRLSDALAEMAANRIDNLHDLTLLNEAATVPRADSDPRLLGPGYGFPAGRESLLDHIANPDALKGERVRCARLLEGAGGEYATSIDDTKSLGTGGTYALKQTGSRGKGNAHYLTRIAELAHEFESDKELGGAILGSLDVLVQETSNDDQSPGVKEDRTSVPPIMHKIAVTAKIKEIKDEALRIINIQNHPHGPY